MSGENKPKAADARRERGRRLTEHKRGETASKGLSARQEAILAALPDIIMEVDNDKVYTWANQAGYDFFGADVIGKAAAYFFEGEQNTYRIVQPLFAGAEGVIYVESWQRRKDGRNRLLAWRCRTLKDEFGNIKGALSAATDITERRRADEALIESEGKFRSFFEMSADLVCIADISGRFRQINKSWPKVLGYSEEEILGRPFMDFIHSDDKAKTAQIIEEKLRRGETILSFENRYVRKDGGIVWLEWTSQPAAAGDRTFAIARDVTERKRTDESLRDSERKLKTIFEVLPVGISILDADRNIVYVNPALEKIVGISKEGLGRGDYRIRGYLRTDGKPMADKELASIRALAEQTAVHDVETGIVKEDGRLIWTNVSAVPVIFPDWKVVIVTSDITKRKQAEDALYRGEVQLQAILESTADGILAVDDKGKVLKANRRFAELWRIPQPLVESGDDQALLDFVMSQLSDPDAFLRKVKMLYRSDAVDIDTLAFKDGRVFERLSFPMSIEGAIIGRVWSFRDITARIRADEALQESEVKYRHLFDNAVEGVYHTTLEGRLLSVNKAFAKMFGYDSPDEIIRIVVDIPRQLYANAEDRNRAVRFLKETGVLKDFECRMRKKDGSVIWVSINARLKETRNDSIGFEGFITEITQRKRAEEGIRTLNAELELRVQARTAELEAANKELEAFTYSVSHDLRAPLRAIDGFSRILLDEHASQLPAAAQRYLGLVRSNTLQMGRLVDDLLAFSRLGRQAMIKDQVEPAALAREAWDLLQDAQGGRPVKMTVGDLPTCQGDRALLKQVFTNLLSNALKFTRQRDPAVIEVGCLRMDGKNVFFVRDNGVGFEMRYAGKLFGIFQRLHRSEDYEGTGVGLAIVQQIIHRHSGRVWAEAEPDKGATFFFSLGGKLS